MTLDEIKRAIAQLSPEDRAALRAWLTQGDGGNNKPPSGEETTATKLGRLTGRAIADVRKRLNEG